MPEELYSLEWLEETLERFEETLIDFDIEIMLDALNAQEERDLLMHADAVVMLKHHEEWALKALALNKAVVAPGETVEGDYKQFMHITQDGFKLVLQQVYAERGYPRNSRAWIVELVRQQRLSTWKNGDMIYVSSQRDLSHLPAQFSKNGLILTDDFESFVRLRENGYLVLLCQELLTQDQIEYGGDEASQLAESWHKEQFVIEYGGQNLVEQCQYDLWYALRGLYQCNIGFFEKFKISMLLNACIFLTR